jgi:hypothetical protein
MSWRSGRTENDANNSNRDYHQSSVEKASALHCFLHRLVTDPACHTLSSRLHQWGLAKSIHVCTIQWNCEYSHIHSNNTVGSCSVQALYFVITLYLYPTVSARSSAIIMVRRRKHILWLVAIFCFTRVGPVALSVISSCYRTIDGSSWLQPCNEFWTTCNLFCENCTRNAERVFNTSRPIGLGPQ